jgi:hypothetical protein
MTRGAVRIGLLLIAGVVVVGCGDPDIASGNPTDDQPVSPLAELMGWDQQYNEVEARAQQLEQEEAVAACMREEGFEYTPVDYSAQGPQVVDDAAELYNDPKAFGEKYGYGVVHNYELWEEPNFNADGELSYAGEEGFVDPNWEYQQTLSQSEQQAYQELLYGDQSMYEVSAIAEGDFTSEDVPAATMSMPTLEEQGCYGKAQQEVYGDQPYQDPDIQERMNEYYENQQNDPELEAAFEDWLACMVDELGNLEDMAEDDRVALIGITTPDTMYSYVDGLKQIAQGLEIVETDPDTGMPVGASSDDEFGMSMYGGGEGWASVGTPKPMSETDLEALRQRELELWKVDFGCQEDVDLAGIRKRSEQRLVDELIADFPELTETADK